MLSRRVGCKNSKLYLFILYSMLRLFQRKEIALISFVFVKLFTIHTMPSG